MNNELTASISNDDGYYEFESQIRKRIGKLSDPLFYANTENLFQVYLLSIPESQRQQFNCSCCRTFMERFGNIVSIDEHGKQTSPLWDESEIPSFFQAAVKAMRLAVESAEVAGVFLSNAATFGTPKSPKGWTHLSGVNPLPFQNSRLMSASQRQAELKEDYAILGRAISHYSFTTVKNALQILKSEQFPGFEKGVSIAEWFDKLLTQLNGVRNARAKKNLLWRTVAMAPPGWAHLSNGMVGTLLEDLQSGKSFEQCKRSWATKMHPLQYQRPSAPVSENQIAVAEKLVEKLGVGPALKRSFATLDQIKNILWRPLVDQQKPAKSGVFGHLKPDTLQHNIAIPNSNVTWAKFFRDILPTAHTMEINCPLHGSYVGILTAEDYDAKPIMQWDSLEDRNPTSHYFYHNGSDASKWGIESGWNPVAAVFTAPHGNVLSHFQKFIVFNVERMRDSSADSACLFPEFLKTELREIRAVIEKYSNKAKPSRAEIGNANGLAFNKDSLVSVRVNGNAIYTIDRFE
jgi:hypothetical protein